MKPTTRARLSRTHRVLGMVATIPILAWVASSFVLHGVGLTLANGLQGVYRLQKYHEAELHLEDQRLLGPSDILRQMADDGFDRVYWLRLEVLGDVPVYVAKPGPYDVERIYDAATGRRLDPLPEEILRKVADGELEGSWAVETHAVDEFNRYYRVDRVEALALSMEGAPPTELVISRTGRTLRRTDPLAEWFHRAYRSVHVWQWRDQVRLFTSVLYGLVGLTLMLVTLGYVLWWDRREARKRWTKQVRGERRIHGRLAPIAGFLLATQMLVGAYLWFNLGLIEPRFRGQGSFAEEWVGGLSVTEELAPVGKIAATLPGDLRGLGRPVQRYEWRALGDNRFWVVYPTRDEEGVLVDARSGTRVDRLSPDQAKVAAESVVAGRAIGDARESVEYWMDFNARVPTYRFRFTDPDATDVHVSQVTGEVVQRRPAIWRGFGPFLAYHTFGFTGNPWLDTLLLTALQLTVLTMVVTGWRLRGL